MSAYIVEDITINTIISAAIEKSLLPIEDGPKWAQQLANENVNSVNYRYSENNSFIIDFDYAEVVLPENNRCGWGREDKTRNDFVLSCIGELRYQSCEHPEWTESHACKFLGLVENFLQGNPLDDKSGTGASRVALNGAILKAI